MKIIIIVIMILSITSKWFAIEVSSEILMYTIFILLDKFDQFWTVNKRLMENPGEQYFKYIPFRLYQVKYFCMF